MVFRNVALLFALVLAPPTAHGSFYNCVRNLTGSSFWRQHQPGDDRVEWVTDSAQLSDVKKVLAQAFQGDPLMNWFHPTPEVQEALLGTIVNHAFLNGGIVQVKGGQTGAALWFESEKAPTGLLSILLTGQVLVIPRFGLHTFDILKFDAHCALKRKEAVNDLKGGSAAPGRPLYLYFVGVTPAEQGKGFASALIRPVLDLADSEHRPVVLETQKVPNVQIYQHLGFETGPWWAVPADAPPTMTMVRPAR